MIEIEGPVCHLPGAFLDKSFNILYLMSGTGTVVQYNKSILSVWPFLCGFL